MVLGHRDSKILRSPNFALCASHRTSNSRCVTRPQTDSIRPQHLQGQTYWWEAGFQECGVQDHTAAEQTHQQEERGYLHY